MVVIMDKSSSLCARTGDGKLDCAGAGTIWPAATDALRSFLTSPRSAGMSLAVTVFGPVDSKNPNTVANNRCDAEDYANPTHAARDLPSAELANEVIAQRPAFDNDTDYNATMTQIGPAIEGATTYMTARREALNGAKEVAMLLISDGAPSGCAGDPYNATDADQALAITAATAAAQAGFKLYVLNIGGDAAKLNAIAAAGGTEQAITVADPRNAEDIGEALTEIRGNLLPCDLTIPTPEAGQPNFNQLNLTLTSSSGEELLYKTASCVENPRGWQYDDPNTPTRILLCEDACNAVQSTVNGQLNVVLGCETRTQGPN